MDTVLSKIDQSKKLMCFVSTKKVSTRGGEIDTKEKGVTPMRSMKEAR